MRNRVPRATSANRCSCASRTDRAGVEPSARVSLWCRTFAGLLSASGLRSRLGQKVLLAPFVAQAAKLIEHAIELFRLVEEEIGAAVHAGLAIVGRGMI